MNGDINISYSYTQGGSSPAPQKHTVSGHVTDRALYAFEECSVVRIPSGGVLLVHKHKERQTAVSNDVAVALEHCKQFRTLQGQAEFLTEYMPELGGDVAGVRAVLEQMRDAGVLTAASELVAQFATAPVQEPDPAPSRAFIDTCDRPEALERLLGTLSAGADLGLHERFYVIDDSRRSENAAKNLELVNAFNRQSPVHIEYFGLQERKRLIKGLVERLPDLQEEIRFLLDQQRWYRHKTYSIPRSLSQLLSVGCRALMMDDDVLCHSYESPGAQPGFEFVENVGEAVFYPSNEAWLASATRRDEDPLAGHLKCLGRPVQGVLRELGLAPLDAAQLAGSEAKQLRGLDAGSRVLITQCGTFGDPGTSGLSWVLLLKGASLRGLLERPEGVEATVRNRVCWLGRARATFTRHAMMSGVTGVDNTTLLPPYIPAGRGGDEAFAYMTEFLHPKSLAFDYPWAVPHLPIDERVGTVGWTGDKGTASMLWNYIRNHVSEDTSLPLDNRLDALVHTIRNISERSNASLAAEFRAEIAAQQAASARQVMNQLRDMPVPNAQWKKLLEQRRHLIFQALGRSEVPVVAYEHEDLGEAELFDNLRRLATGFANALQAWPRIRAAAQQIIG